MNTTFSTTGLAQTTGSTRRVSSLFRSYWGAFQERRKRQRLRATGLPAMAQERPVRVERRLLAILAADVAGYSRLMHNDEESTHTRLTTLLSDAVAPAIADHGGRTVKRTGDGFLAEFPSAVEVVRAAVQFQTRIKELTAADAEDKRIAFRVGINIGDVIVEPHDIFGDGVNIAARLEGIAEPGGICISSSARSTRQRLPQRPQSRSIQTSSSAPATEHTVITKPTSPSDSVAMRTCGLLGYPEG